MLLKLDLAIGVLALLATVASAIGIAREDHWGRRSALLFIVAGCVMLWCVIFAVVGWWLGGGR